MKTLLLSEIFPPRNGGSGRWFYEIYRRLDPDRYVMAVGAADGQESFDREEQMAIERLAMTMPRWGVLSSNGLRDYFRLGWTLRKLIKRHRIERIHCGRCLPEGVLALALKKLLRIPYLVYIHGEDISTATNSREYTWLVKSVLRNADFCIANSHNTAAMLRGHWRLPEHCVRVLHPGVDVNRFVPNRRCDRIRRQLGWGDRPVVLTVGRLQQRKGQDMLIRALADIRIRIPEILYVIVGDGDQRDALQRLVVELGLTANVQFKGEPNDSELIACYQQCDLFALPNREIDGDIEGFGMVLLEAQACGKPVVAGASGGTSETLLDPETGRVVVCDNPENLAELLPKMLSNPDQLIEMGQRGRHWVESRFSWDVLAQEASELFDMHQQTSAQGIYERAVEVAVPLHRPAIELNRKRI
jgi:phosphatidylinositol alpha-1,6-mannosyltransferase